LNSIIEYLDDFSKQTQIYELNGKKLVVKNYRKETGILKWLVINATNLTINIYPFAFQPLKRLERECFFFKEAPEVFSKPKIYLVDFVKLKLVREYVEGVSYSSILDDADLWKLGDRLCRLHLEGWALGDSKVSNFVSTGGGIYIVDAEEAIQTRDVRHYAWDLIVLASTMVFFNFDKIVQRRSELEEAVKSFIRGYVETDYGVSRQVVSAFEKPSFKALIYLLMPHPFSKIYITTWREYVAKEF
jgi:tRNA A-37 threonylcarbamoyl transferase component Bud32